MLLALPVFGLAGFSWLASASSLVAIQFSMIATRACEFATAKPARETLYTVVSREEKYQAKGFIDTFVYRGGDMVGAWLFLGLRTLFVPAEADAGAAPSAGHAQSGTALVGVAVGLCFTAAAFVLGRRQEALAKAVAGREVPSAPAPTSSTSLESGERRA